MSSFNDHETRRLPNGNILLLGARDESSTMYQGGTQQDPVDILGDMILILDHNMQLIWAWDTFAHQDLSREATSGEICVHDTAGCPAFSRNFRRPMIGCIPMPCRLRRTETSCFRAQPGLALKYCLQQWPGRWTWMWKMGPYGDFTITNPPHQTCGDPNVFPWFTHQHDAAFQKSTGFAKY